MGTSVKVSAGLVLFFLLGVSRAFAQVSTGQIDPVQFIVTPDTPGPNQSVSIEVQGIGTFLGSATITWQVNGKAVLSGVGERTVTFTTGALGNETDVHIVINSATQGTIVRDFVFIPSTVNLLWEAGTSVPLFYRGKALYSPGSSLKVLALPTVVANGATISSNNLSFQWSRNGNPMPNQSGKGLSAFSFTGDQLRSGEDVSVDVYLGDVKVGYGEVVVPASTPKLLLYDHDPLQGTLLDNALPGSVTLTGKEVTLEATPYFFSNDSLANGGLSYAWTLNGQSTTGPDAQKGVLTLRQTGQGSGSATVGVSLQNSDANKFLQTASAALQIVFGQSNTNSSLFGL